MRIAIDLPADYPPGWKIAAGAFEYATITSDVDILLPHARLSKQEDTSPDNWDGAIVQLPRPDLGIPQVCVSPYPNDQAITVNIDQAEVVRLALEQFVSMGLRSFAFFGPENWEISQLRWGYFSEQAEELGSQPVFIPSWSPEEHLVQVRKPCGIMSVNDNQATWLLRACKTLGLRLPGDVHVISIDDLPVCLETTPTISSISMPFSLIGYHAANLCDQMIKGAAVESIKLRPSGLIIRDSIKVEKDDIRTASEVAHYLRTHLSYPVQMEDIVRLSSVSRRQLEEVFRSTYGSSPIAYLKKLRLEKAKQLLESSDMRLKEVVKECGYRDTNHLCRIFRERVGMSPMAYGQMEHDASD